MVCRAKADKRALVRVTRSPTGVIAIDEKGTGPGRGAYLCRRRACWADRAAMARLAHGLRTTLSAQDRAVLADYAARLPAEVAPEGVGMV